MSEWLSGIWQTLPGKAACIAAGALSLWLCRLLVMVLRIRYCRGRMIAYGEFLRETFTQCGKPVPAMFMTYLQRDVERYNRSRGGWPFRYWWREIDKAQLDRGLHTLLPDIVSKDGVVDSKCS